MKALKILQINKYFYPKGGSESALFSLIALLRSKGHEVIEFSMKDEKNLPSKYEDYFIDPIDFQQREGFIEDVKKVFHALYSIEAKKKLERLIIDEKPDIAHLHNFHTQLTPSILKVLYKHNIPVVWTMHDISVVGPRSIGGSKDTFTFIQGIIANLEVFLHKYILRSYRYIDIYISPSKFLKRKIKEWGIKDEKIAQIYNMVDTGSIPVTTETGEYVLFFGRLSEEKGVDILLTAVKDISNIPVKIVGEGPFSQNLEEYIKIHDIKHIEVLGRKEGAELAASIAGAAFIVVPSIVQENNPMSILESFAHGKPVIGSDLGGIPELIGKGEETRGLLFEAGNAKDLCDKIKNLYGKNERIQILGKNARDFVEDNCSPEKHYEKTLEVYARLLNLSEADGNQSFRVR